MEGGAWVGAPRQKTSDVSPGKVAFEEETTLFLAPRIRRATGLSQAPPALSLPPSRSLLAACSILASLSIG